MIRKSLTSGLAQVWVNKRMILVFYLANLFIGLLLMLPLRTVVSQFAGHSLAGAKLAGHLDMDFLVELLKYDSAAIASIGGLFLIVPAAYWLFTLFLSGGALAVFAGCDKYTPSMFWGAAAKYFGRFFRLALWCLPIFAVLFCLQFLVPLAKRVIYGPDPYEYVSYWADWVKVGLRFISILLFGLVLDYGRIHAVLDGDKRMRVSLWRGGLKFVLRHLPITFSLAFLLLLAGIVVLAIYNPIADRLSAPTALTIFVLFVVQQGYMFFRMILRLTLYSSELHLYKGLSVAPEPMTVEATDELGLEQASPESA